ncbi:hypothetical protein P879_10096 [Paragonimus westermani]|uniref:Uncharacterized protein n=1 Tax=Paragonimus westermani TaxID=34504 RepID=A0A8T0DI30_9TREM|nr:hypothetical protein P879_10096 [Paragonimus westermani]
MSKVCIYVLSEILRGQCRTIVRTLLICILVAQTFSYRLHPRYEILNQHRSNMKEELSPGLSTEDDLWEPVLTTIKKRSRNVIPPPKAPANFVDPEEVKRYLYALNDYFIAIGRPSVLLVLIENWYLKKQLLWADDLQLFWQFTTRSPSGVDKIKPCLMAMLHSTHDV